MDILSINGVSVIGVTACVPPNIKQNSEECIELFGASIGNLLKATGIHSRCVVDPGTTTLDLNICAAKDLLKKSNTDVEEIGAVICVTFTPENVMPADASSAQHRLGIPNHCVAFDMNMACSGYIYGLYMATTFVKALNKKVLLLDGDVHSYVVSPQDKATMPNFSDIGTATLLGPDAGIADKWEFSFYTDGGGKDSLIIPAGGTKNPVSVSDLEYIKYKDGSKRRNVDIYMDGVAVFSFVFVEACGFIKQFMEVNGITAQNIDGFIPHQANMYMIRQLTKKLSFSPNQMWQSGELYGNPGSASIPLTIAHCADEWFEAGKGKRILISAFGGGLSVGVCHLELNEKGCYSVVKFGKPI